ncbi:hypothetical protein hamaS1_16920 [Moorella sp. Hama-1]|nr:hypothetical protein hamaS1_16920 [Moorella sp. Hama-1]
MLIGRQVVVKDRLQVFPVAAVHPGRADHSARPGKTDYKGVIPPINFFPA